MTTGPTESAENPIRIQIMRMALEQFFARGFSKVTTDELASSLGISKKTLYQHFASKEELLRESITLMRCEMGAQIDRIVDSRDADFVEKLRGVMTIIGTKISTFQRASIEDIQRKAPEIWAEMEAYRREKILTVFTRLMTQGSRKGMLRKNVDPQLFVMMFFSIIQSMTDPRVIADLPFSITEGFNSFIDVMLTGVLTDEARGDFLSDR